MVQILKYFQFYFVFQEITFPGFSPVSGEGILKQQSKVKPIKSNLSYNPFSKNIKTSDKGHEN